MKLVRLLPLLAALLCASAVFAQTSTVDPQKMELQELKQLETQQKADKAKFLKKPKNAALKKTYIKSTLKLAYETMTSLALPPKVKYPGSLRLYREVLKVDPKNAEAIKNKNMMEDIYKKMGLPIPK